MAADVVAIAAVAENGVIGRDGEMPWDEVEGDLERFRRETTDHPVIMGRVTYESIADRLGGPLPDRQNIVVSESRHYHGDDVRTVSSPGSALSLALTIDDAVYVVGGESIYRALLPLCTRMVITRVPGEYEGDAVFPDWDEYVWDVDGRDELPGGAEVVEYEKADTI